MRPQTIQIYLPFGDPQGIRIAEFTTRTVQVFDVPRSEVSAFFEMPESEQVAVYYLFSDENGDGRTQCYIGQTNSTKARFKDHLKSKDFWTRALIAVSRTNAKTATHAIYLEWKSIQEGNEAGRYSIKNGNAGMKPHTPGPLLAECEEIFETIGTLLATLGYPLFQKLNTTTIKDSDHEVYCKKRGANAKGIFSSDGLTILKGSTCAAKPAGVATNESVLTQRKRLLEDGSLEMIGDVPTFTRDTLFKAPSSAASAVLYRTANGWIEWRTQGGKTLNDAIGRKVGKAAEE